MLVKWLHDKTWHHHIVTTENLKNFSLKKTNPRVHTEELSLV